MTSMAFVREPQLSECDSKFCTGALLLQRTLNTGFENDCVKVLGLCVLPQARRMD